jgi:hypothetical protein
VTCSREARTDFCGAHELAEMLVHIVDEVRRHHLGRGLGSASRLEREERGLLVDLRREDLALLDAGQAHLEQELALAHVGHAGEEPTRLGLLAPLARHRFRIGRGRAEPSSRFNQRSSEIVSSEKSPSTREALRGVLFKPKEASPETLGGGEGKTPT